MQYTVALVHEYILIMNYGKSFVYVSSIIFK